MKNNRTILAVVGIGLLMIVMRVMPYLMIAAKNAETTPGISFYPSNFSPLTAACLCMGCLFGNRRLAPFLCTLSILALCDLATGFAMKNMEFAFHSLIPFTYAASLFSVWLGSFLKTNKTLLWAAPCAALVADLTFFFVTNAGNWWLMPTHPHNLAGLIATYRDGIPFFRHQLAGTALYGLFFSGIAFALEKAPASAAEPSLGTAE